MIYADGVCESTGRYGNTQLAGGFLPAADMANYWAHWKYNRGDSGYRQLLASTPYYAIWDDHEVANDFGPLHDTRDTTPYTPGVKLLPKGLHAFLDYNPIAENAQTPKRLYRSINWGKNMEMFILDTRQYRDANFEADDVAHPKTMLGREQVVWLKQALQSSTATWKVIVSSVPMSIPTGSSGPRGRDGWANYEQAGGFEHELVEILRFMQGKGMNNVVFLTTDVHFAEVFRYVPFEDAPEFVVHEFVAGPINAGVFPNRAFDDSLNAERLFFYGADNASDVTTWEQAKSWFNYGAIRIDDNGELTASINDVKGDELYAIQLQPK
jgi:alkaline phosphatase D